MTSAELAKVREVTPVRAFRAANDDGIEHVIVYSVDRDSLYCTFHKVDDNCTCSSRVRLCGILTGSVIQNVKRWKDFTDKSTAHAAATEN